MMRVFASICALLVWPGAAWADAGWLSPRKTELFAGANASDYSTVEADEPVVLGVDGSLLLRPPLPLQFQLDGWLAALGTETLAWAAAPRAFVPWSSGLLGASYTLMRIEPTVAVHRVALDARLDEADWLSITLCAGYERAHPGEDLVFGELLVHVFPHARWTITSGFSYAQAQIKQTRADILIRGEYMWLARASTSVAAYLSYGGNLLTRASLGLVVYFDGLTSAARARERGVFASRLR